MPIRWVLNGYYRSGTTIVFYLVRKSHPKMLHLYEPLTPNTVEAVKGHPPGSVAKLHGLEGLYDDYYKIPNLDELLSKHRRMDFILPFSLKEVKEFLDEIHRLPYDVLIQPNNAHFILGELKEEYGCKVVHLVRHPADCWASHFPGMQSQVTPDTPATEGHPPSIGAFWLYPTFDRLYEHFGDYLDCKGIHPNSKDIDKFLACWYLSNLHARKHADYIFKIEDVASNPKIMIPEIDEKYYHVFNPNRLKRANSRLKEWVSKRLRMLGWGGGLGYV